MKKETHRYLFCKDHFGGSRTDVLIKLILVFFIALLSFSVGTYVGKQFSDSEHKLSHLKAEYSSTQASESSHADHPRVLTESDIENLADEFIAEEIVEPSTMDLEMGGESERLPASSDEDGEVEKTVEYQGENPFDQNQEVSNPPIEKVDLPRSYTVQIASYENSENAIQHVNELKEKEYDAMIMQAEINNTTWYRVTLGLFPQRGEALQFMKKVKADLNLENALIQTVFAKPQ